MEHRLFRLGRYLLTLFLLSVLFTSPSLAFLLGWDYRQAINISNTAGDLTDYQVRIDLDSTNVGVNFNWSNNGNDIRFTNSSDDLIPYWIESWDSTNKKATIWVKVPSLPTGTTTIYMYYGNQAASSASNATATFIREIDGVVGSWHFDEGSGTTAYDTSGNGKDGTIYGATWVDGNFGKALSFDGVNDYIYIGNDAILNPQILTITFWMKPMALGTQQNVICRGVNTGYARDYTLIIAADGKLNFWFGEDSANYVSVDTSSTLTEGQWVFVTAVRDGTNAKIYLNEELNNFATYGFTPVNKGHTTQISRLGSSTSNYFKGLIDEVRIYNKALSPEEILDLYNNYGYTTTNYPGKVLVRKYASPEPTISSIGSEESSNQPPIITINEPKNQTYYTTSIPLNISYYDLEGDEFTCDLYVDGIWKNSQTVPAGLSGGEMINTLSQIGGSHNVSVNCTDANGATSSEVVNYYVWMGLNVSVYYDNGTEAINWNISITNGTDNYSQMANNTLMLEWNTIPYGNINITIDDGSDSLYYYQNKTTAVNNETTYTILNITLIEKSDNPIDLSASPSWIVMEGQSVSLSCSAPEGSPTLYVQNILVSNPYTLTTETGTYTVLCSVETETTNYKPTNVSNNLIANPLSACTNNETFAFKLDYTTSTDITSFNFSDLISKNYVREDLGDIYVPNVSNVWKNGPVIIINNTGKTDITLYFGNYYVNNSYSTHAIENLHDVSGYTQINPYIIYNLLNEVDGEPMYPPNASLILSYLSCKEGQNYIPVEQNTTRFLIATKDYPDKIAVRVQYTADSYYSRVFYPETQQDVYVENFYLVDAYKYALDRIDFLMLDTNYYDAKLQLYKYLGNMSVVITEGYFDVSHILSVWLMEDIDYYIRTKNPDAEFGRISVVEPTTKTLGQQTINLNPGAVLISDNILMNAYRTNNTLYIQYNDKLNGTEQVNITIKYQNGTTFQQLSYSDTSSISVDYDISNWTNETFDVEFSAKHKDFDNVITYSIYVTPSIFFDLGVSSVWYSLFSLFILLLVGGLFTRTSVVAGVLIFTTTLIMLMAIGWLSIPYAVVGFVIFMGFLSIIMYLKESGGG